MPRVKIGPALPDRRSVEDEIARLRDLDSKALRARWHIVFGRPPPRALAPHLIYRTLAYRLQADVLGDLDAASIRLLDRSASPEQAAQRAAVRSFNILRPGTILSREWRGRVHRVAVLAEGFAWNGTTYPSLSKVACAITGTRWNGPRFFGMRDEVSNGDGR